MIELSSNHVSISAFQLASPRLTDLAGRVPACLPESLLAAAEAEIRTWPGYAVTPLLNLEPLANH